MLGYYANREESKSPKAVASAAAEILPTEAYGDNESILSML
jgi:hypothetical protein